jgi:preprotein translocase subunit SecD
MLLIITVTVLALIFSLPSIPLFSSMPQWWKDYMPDKGMILGLDLQGGVHLVFEVEGDKAVDITEERIAARLLDMLKEKEIEATVKKDDSGITIKPSNEEIKNMVDKNYPNLTLQNQSQEMMLYRLSAREIDLIKDSSVDQALETIRNRVDQFGVREPTIHRQAANEIVVQLPGVKETKRAIDLIGKTAILEFKLLDDEHPVAAQLPETMQGNKKSIFNEKTDSDDRRPPDRGEGQYRPAVQRTVRIIVL